MKRTAIYDGISYLFMAFSSCIFLVTAYSSINESDHSVWGLPGDIMLWVTLYLPMLIAEITLYRNVRNLLFQAANSITRTLLRVSLSVVSLLFLLGYCIVLFWLSK